MRLFIILLASFAFTGTLMTSQADTEEPKYALITSDGDYEIRQYEPKIVAEVDITGDPATASNRGFRPLADYIFGNNTVSEKIEMTAPVTQKKSTKIAMTAPVTQQAGENDTTTIAFTMPAKWSMESLPQPNNPDVRIRLVPAQLMATVRFNGRGRNKKEARKRAELQEWITAQGYEMIGAPIGAYYNAPWIPGFARRNEVIIPVAPRAAAASPKE